MHDEQEILLIDKPVGISSFDVIRRLRKRYSDTHDGARAPKMGHAGTLDPLASGLMIIGVGAGTKKLNEYLKLPKEYIAEILVGERRSTGDMEGELLDEADVPEFAAEQVTEVLAGMVGTLTLPVSAYSAIKKDGVPMYKRARAAAQRGQQLNEAKLPIRSMEVTEAELLGIENTPIDWNNRAIVRVRFFVGSGTYIRSLGEELGKRLGYPATLKSLRRTQIGEWQIEEAMTFDTVW